MMRMSRNLLIAFYFAVGNSALVAQVQPTRTIPERPSTQLVGVNFSCVEPLMGPTPTQNQVRACNAIVVANEGRINEHFKRLDRYRTAILNLRTEWRALPRNQRWRTYTTDLAFLDQEIQKLGSEGVYFRSYQEAQAQAENARAVIRALRGR